MSRLYTRLCAGVLFPLHERVKGHSTVRRRRELEQTQWWSPERIRALQVERLRTLLRWSGQNVPYYRELFAHIGFNPESIRSLADLARLPVLTKESLRARSADFRAAGERRLISLSTTGSSGDPMQFYVGPDRVSHDVAAKWRATRWWGVDIGDPEIVAWSSPIELTRQDRVRKLRDTLLRTQLVPSIALTPDSILAAIERIRAVRPAMLFGYPSSLALIAAHAEDRNIDMGDLGIKVAFVTAERLLAHQRAQISRVFRCPVADGYGGRDAGFIAHECPSGGLHISAEDIIVEVVDDTGRPVPTGEAGEVVVTHLASWDYPFIRYKNGDIGVLDDRRCDCGRGLPLIREIQGRSNDFIIAADGSVVHGVAFGMVMRDTPGIRAFKIIQEDIGHTRVLLSVNAHYHPESAQRIRDALNARLGNAVQVTVEIVPEILPEPTGKYRYVVSRIARNSHPARPENTQPLERKVRQSTGQIG